MHHGPELTVVLIAIFGLAVGAGLRLVSSRLSFPYTIAVLLFGLGTGLVLEGTGAAHGDGIGHLLGRGAFITSDLIIFVFLPALVFESAYAIEVHEFRKNLGAVLLLAGPALVLSTVLIAALMVGLTRGSWSWGWSAALVFGALISATDPVAVVAILRELGVTKRLGILIEGESLLNDGTSIVVFTALIGMLSGATPEFSGTGAVLDFLKVVIGGVVVGLLLGFVLSKWIERLFNDPLSEITLTLVLAYSAMVIAEAMLHVSGVMAVVVAGLYMSAQGKTRVSPEVSHFLHRFWGLLGFIANTLIFLLVGLVIAGEGRRATALDIALIAAAYAGVMGVRFFLTYAFQPLVNRLSEGVSASDSAVISWGGLRGAVSLALGLVVSQNPAIDPETGHQILLVTAGVVFLTILVNGSTIGRLLAKLGYNKPPLGEELARLSGRASVLEGVADSLEDLSRSRDLRTVPWGEVQERLSARRAALAEQIGSVMDELGRAPPVERIASYWSRAIAVERQAYWEAFAAGTLSGLAVKLLSHELDLHLDRLAQGHADPPEHRAPVDSIGKGLFGAIGGDGTGYERLALVYDLSRAESLAAERVLSALEGMKDIARESRDALRETYQRYLRLGKERLEDIRTNLPEISMVIESRLARRIELNLEREGLESLARRGVLDEATVHAELESVEEQMHELVRKREQVALPETADLVASTPLFAQLDASALSELAEITEEMILSPGQYLFREGDTGDALYVIARGAVHVIVGDHVVDVLGGGDILGEISLLTGAPRTASIRAATTVTLGKIERTRFEGLVRKHPELGQQIWRAFSRRTFDNRVRTAPAFAYLDRRARLAWFDAGRLVRLLSSEHHSLGAADRYVFVAAGRVGADGRALERGAFEALEGISALSAREDSWITVLPEIPHDPERAPAD
jgi:Na+/H+ antiporter